MSVPIKRRLQRVASTFNAKARKLHVPGVVSWQMLAVMPERCHYCDIHLTLDQGSWDHVLAFDRGGTNEITNIVRCCTDCQRRKHTKTPKEFAEHRVLVVTCKRPGCGVSYTPRWAEWINGRARYHSRACAGAARGHPEW